MDQLIVLYSIGYMYTTQGRFKEAENILDQILKKTEGEMREFWDPFVETVIGYIQFVRGQYDEYLKKFNRSIIDKKEQYYVRYVQAITLYITAMVYLEKNQWDRAEEFEVELQEWTRKRANKKLVRWHYLLRGQMELKKTKFTAAIDYLTRAVSLLYNEMDESGYVYRSIFFEALARAQLESGNLEKAANLFEKITNFTFGRFQSGDIYARAFYELGKILQKQNNKVKAIQRYNQFIELWKNCDPLFQPMVKDAQKRVKDLDGEI